MLLLLYFYIIIQFFFWVLFGERMGHQTEYISESRIIIKNKKILLLLLVMVGEEGKYFLYFCFSSDCCCNPLWQVCTVDSYIKFTISISLKKTVVAFDVIEQLFMNYWPILTITTCVFYWWMFELKERKIRHFKGIDLQNTKKYNIKKTEYTHREGEQQRSESEWVNIGGGLGVVVAVFMCAFFPYTPRYIYTHTHIFFPHRCWCFSLFYNRTQFLYFPHFPCCLLIFFSSFFRSCFSFFFGGKSFTIFIFSFIRVRTTTTKRRNFKWRFMEYITHKKKENI